MAPRDLECLHLYVIGCSACDSKALQQTASIIVRDSSSSAEGVLADKAVLFERFQVEFYLRFMTSFQPCSKTALANSAALEVVPVPEMKRVMHPQYFVLPAQPLTRKWAKNKNVPR
jgi:hypothetical protein